MIDARVFHPATRERLSLAQWRLILLLMGVCFLGHMNRLSLATAADLRIMPEYGISTSTMGAIYSAFLLTYTLSMIPGGWLIDLRGPRFSLAVVCLGSAGFVTLTAAVGMFSSATATIALLLVIRALMGIINSPLHPASATAVSLGIPHERRSAANGWITGAALLGIASTYPLFATLIEWFDWPGAFLVTALATALLGALWLRWGPRRENRAADSVADLSSPTAFSRGKLAESSSPRRAWLVRHKNLILLTLSYGAVGYFQYMFFYWLHHYLRSVLHLSEARSVFFAGVPPLAMAIGMPLGGWLSDRLLAGWGWRAARPGLAGIAMGSSAVLLWFGAQATGATGSIVLLSLSLGVLGMAEGPFWATAVDVGGSRGGTSAAIFNTGGNGIGQLAPLATPIISDDLGFGWQAGLLVGSVVCLAGAMCWIWIDQGDITPDSLHAIELVPPSSVIHPS